ncbi:MAG: 3'-5' exonuclease [Epsilonproteobacteria bacterium]|nr:3'-5' exonuclease [Campylobacterota bacterium]
MIDRIKYILNRKSLKDERFSFLFDSEKYKDEVVAVDIESTGLNYKKDEILSIGAVKIKGNKILINESFEIFCKPKKKISEESIKIHHIRPCDIQNGIDIQEAILKLLDFIEGRAILGYYIKFDYEMISKYAKSLIGCKLPNKTIELSSMYYKRKKKSSAYDFIDLKFDTILKELDLPKLGKHDALNDAIMSAMMYLKLKRMPIYKGAFS